jgi:hypothetical protein
VTTGGIIYAEPNRQVVYGGGGGAAAASFPTSWHIASTGNDAGDGSASSPLKTFAELVRRARALNQPIVANGTIQFDDASSEALDLGALPLDGAATWTIQGAPPTVLATGAVSAVTAYNAGSGSFGVTGSITDSSQSSSSFWTPFVGKLVILTSGTNAGAWAWVDADLGSKAARLSPFWDPNFFSWITPTIGDAYEIVDIVTLSGFIGTFGRGDGVVNVKQLHFTGLVYHYGGQTTFAACRFDNTANFFSTLYLDLFGCDFAADVTFQSKNDQGYVDACRFGARLRMFGGTIQLSTHCLFSGASAIIDHKGGVLIVEDDVAMVGFTSVPIRLVNFYGPAYLNLLGRIYGAAGSNPAWVVQTDAPATVALSDTAKCPRLAAGSSGYASLGGTTKATVSTVNTASVLTANGAGWIYPAI